ncbi:MAG: CBS domain-containing protein, partial [Deltaproteobacteria bacterium]|nr:CBS domain-containing protein [Deltaproteobacteria bacterium]
MPIIDYQDVLKGLLVQEAMRRQVIRLPEEAPLEQAIRYTIKYKVNAILITDDRQAGLGVVSKTDLMGAYYAGLPLSTTCGTVMMGPPLFCGVQDTLDQALDTMRTKRVHRLYVRENSFRQAAGVLAYPDIVGLLYRYCNRCERSLRSRSGPEKSISDQWRIREVMTAEIYAHQENDSLQTVMEGLAAYRFGAVLIKTSNGRPAGVLSKTDLILAYKHGLPADTKAREIMTSPVQACDGNAPVVDALKTMIFSDVHRLLVYQDSPQNLVGVLSLSDVARFRSGTCRACLVSR